MVRRNGATVRADRLSQIGRKIATYMPNGVALAEVVKWVKFNIGLTPAKAEEYVLEAVEMQGWVVEDGFIRAE